jgi:hypothetical protein
MTGRASDEIKLPKIADDGMEGDESLHVTGNQLVKTMTPSLKMSHPKVQTSKKKTKEANEN